MLKFTVVFSRGLGFNISALKEVSMDDGCGPRMTKEALVEACVSNEGYEAPELNDCLYLHFRGYQKIENLEEYKNLKGLWLDANGLTKIEGLDHLKSLRCLFLQRNLIAKIENLENLNLVTLDLSENHIRHLEGLPSTLETLNVSKNYLENSESIENLQELQELSNVNLESNKLNDETVLDVLSKIPKLSGLNMTGNPIVRDLRHFRKKCIVAMPMLAYLDRPIFPNERECADAWAMGGVEAEQLVRSEIAQRKKDKDRDDMRIFREWQAKCRKEHLERQAMARHDDGTPNALHQEELAQARLAIEREAQHQADTAALTELGTLGDLLDRNVDPTPFYPQGYVPDPDPLQGSERVGPTTTTTAKGTETVPTTLVPDEVAPLPAPPAPKSDNAKDPVLPPPPGPPSPETVSVQDSEPTTTEMVLKEEPLVAATKEEEEARRRVDESLAIWREKTHPTKDKEVLIPKEEWTWTESMDRRLAKLVHEHAFDFNAIAVDLKTSNLSTLDALACRQRWCVLNGAKNKTDPPKQERPVFRGSSSRLPTFDELQRRAFEAPSCVVPPGKLPSLDDFDDDESLGVVQIDRKITILQSRAN